MAIQFPILLLEIKCDKQYTIKAPIAAISTVQEVTIVPEDQRVKLLETYV